MARLLDKFKKKQTFINTTETEYEDLPDPIKYDANKAFIAYVKGESVQSIAGTYGKEPQEILEDIKEKERDRAKR